MSDEPPTPDPAQGQKGEPAPAPEPKAEETDWKAEARKWEQRAKENSSAAKKLAEIEEASKTELQKAVERAEAAERRAAENELAALKASVAAEKGVLPSTLSGSTKEELEAAADALIAWRDGSAKKPPEPKRLKSGAASGDEPERGRAAAALRQLRGVG